MNRNDLRKQTDLQIIRQWVDEGSHVLDLGCGRGILLEHLQQTKKITSLGIDIDAAKILDCVKRGVAAYQGDIEPLLQQFDDNAFDWVICSRTIQEFENASRVIHQSLRVGKQMVVGFVNAGFWVNRWHLLSQGRHTRNEVFPEAWEKTRPSNPLSIKDFEEFCQKHDITIVHKALLAGDWKSEVKQFANLRTGYALYHIRKS